MGFIKEFDIGVIKTLSMCPCLPSSTKKHVCNELTNLAPFVSDSDRMYLIKFIGEVTSSQSLDSMDEILLEFSILSSVTLTGKGRRIIFLSIF